MYEVQKQTKLSMLMEVRIVAASGFYRGGHQTVLWVLEIVYILVLLRV